MRSIICLFLLLAPVVLIKAQDNKRDSLLKLLPSAKDDTAKVLLLLDIADTYETNFQDSSLYYLEKSRKLSELLGFSKGIYQYYKQSAVISFTKGDYTTAVEQNNKGLIQARLRKDSSNVISILNNIAIVYAYLGDFESQLNYALQVKNAVEAVKDSNKLAPVYHGIANAYFNLKRYRKSTDYALLSVRLTIEFKKRNNYINRVYATLAQDYEALKMSDSALYYYEKAIGESIKANDKYAEGTIYGYLCDLYQGRNQFDEMLKAGEKSLALARELQSRQIVAYSLYNVAYANFFKGNNAKARSDINEALEIATKDTLRDELKNSYMVLSYIAARDGDYEVSGWARRKTDSIQEAVLNEQVIKSTSELEKKYETEKKDKQINLQQAQLERRRIFSLILIGSIAFIFIIVVLIYRQKQKLHRQRISELEKEKQLTSTESVLKGEEQERSRLAKDLHDGLGGMMSGIKYSLQTMKKNLIMTPENQQAFERSMDMLDSSIREMRRVAHNMMPEALVRFGLDTALSDFCDDVNQSGALQVSYQSIGMTKAEIDQTTAITIYRVIQELINNTMKHASARSAIVQVSKTNGIITITVEDDGKGFDPAILQASGGMGWNNIQSRVGYLKGKLDVQSGLGKGTSVHIELNV
jgi:two-component system NarL family sensor kinase